MQQQGYAPQPGYVPQPHPPVTLYYGYSDAQFVPATAYPDSAHTEEVIEKPKCQDACCAVFFFMGFIGFIASLIFAFALHIPKTTTENWQFDQQTLTFLGLAVSAALVLSLGMLMFIQANAACIIWSAMLLNACAWIAIGALCLMLGQIWGIIFFFVGGLLLLYPLCLKNRIAFVAVMVKYSVAALSKYNGVFLLAIASAVLVIGVNIVGGAAMTRVLTHYHSIDPSDNTPTIIILGIFFLVVWMCEFLRYFMHTVVAGVVGVYWYLPNQQFATGPSFKRASTTSLGSVSFAALIVTICTVCRTIARMKWNQLMKGKGGGKNQGLLILLLIVIACIACLFSCFEKALRWINHYALVHCALYGSSFIEGGKRTMDTFFQSGFMMIVQKDLTGFVISIGVLLTTAVSAGCTFLIAWQLGLFHWEKYQDKGEHIAFLVTLGAVLCAYIAHTILTPLQSAVTTTFVCWSEDGAALEQNHAAAYSEMVEAKNKIWM